MKTLICGSLAYDTIMVFGDRFQNHILPEKIHILSVAFLVPEMRREYGGTAGNIAYNLKLLEGEPLIMSTVGHDFADYRQRLDALEIPQTYIREVADAFTAQAFITTDLDDNQITAFHPGAMSASHTHTIDTVPGITMGVISPDGREGMLQHARQFHEARIPFLFDPGQGLPLFSGPELLEFLEQATWLAVNDYEAQLMANKTGLSFEQLATRVDAAIMTQGAQGSRIFAGNEIIPIPAVPTDQVLDPTGCGDAYRAGLMYGLSHHWDWDRTGRLASLLGSLKIAYRGGQNHTVTRAQLDEKLQEKFGFSLDS